MAESKSTFWFAAKKYGWGWGLPVCWQGWVVLAGYLGLLYGGIAVLIPRQSTVAIALYIAALTVAFVALVVWKGERPLQWRWGKESK